MSRPTAASILSFQLFFYSVDIVARRNECNQWCNCWFLRSYGCEVNNHTAYAIAREKTAQQFMENPVIHWDAIVWIQRPLALWIVEFLFALVGLCEALLVAYLTYKGNLWQQIISFYFILEMVNTIPYLFTVRSSRSSFLHSLIQLQLIVISFTRVGVLLSVAPPLYPRLPQLLARKKGTWKHVCKYSFSSLFLNIPIPGLPLRRISQLLHVLFCFPWTNFGQPPTK